MVKRCCYGNCNTDTRYTHRLVGDIEFIPFPKPGRSLEKCQRWIRLCGRSQELLNEDKLRDQVKSKHFYVCTKHFVDGKPTKENPDPVPYVARPDACRDTRRRSERWLTEPPKKKKITSQEPNSTHSQRMDDNASFCEIKVEVFENDDNKIMKPVMENTDISQPSIKEGEAGDANMTNITKIPVGANTNVQQLSRSELDDNIIKIALDASQPSVVDSKSTVDGAFKQDEVILNLIEPQAQRTAYMSLYNWNTWRAHTMQLKKTNFEYIPYFYELCNQRLQYIDTMLAYFVLSCKNKPMSSKLLQTILCGLQTYINTFTKHFNKREVRFNYTHQFPKYEEALKFKVQPFKTASVPNPENYILQTEPSLQTKILQIGEQPTTTIQTIPMPRIEKMSQKSTSNVLPKILPKLAFVNKHYQSDQYTASSTAIQRTASKGELQHMPPSTEAPHSASGKAKSKNSGSQPCLNTDTKSSSEHKDDNDDTETDVPPYIIIKQEPVDDLEYDSVTDDTLNNSKNQNATENPIKYHEDLENSNAENCGIEKNNLFSDDCKSDSASNKRKSTNYNGANATKVPRVIRSRELRALDRQHDSEQSSNKQGVENANDNLHNAEIEYRFYNDSDKKFIKQEIEFKDNGTTMFSCCERNKTGRTVSDIDINFGDYLPENCTIRPSDVNLKRVVFPDGGKMTIKLKYKLDESKD